MLPVPTRLSDGCDGVGRRWVGQTRDWAYRVTRAYAPASVTCYLGRGDKSSRPFLSCLYIVPTKFSNKYLTWLRPQATPLHQIRHPRQCHTWHAAHQPNYGKTGTCALRFASPRSFSSMIFLNGLTATRMRLNRIQDSQAYYHGYSNYTDSVSTPNDQRTT